MDQLWNEVCKSAVFCCIPLMIYEFCLTLFFAHAGVLNELGMDPKGPNDGLLSSLPEIFKIGLLLSVIVVPPILWIIAYNKLEHHCTCQVSLDQDIELALSPVLRQG